MLRTRIVSEYSVSAVITVAAPSPVKGTRIENNASEGIDRRGDAEHPAAKAYVAPRQHRERKREKEAGDHGDYGEDHVLARGRQQLVAAGKDVLRADPRIRLQAILALEGHLWTVQPRR